MKRDYFLYLEDILEAIRKIEKYIGHFSFNAFSDDEKTVDAVIRNFEIIGEASKKIPEETKKKYNDIPWQEMSGLRNILIHEYFGVDKAVIYKTVKDYLPELKNKIKKIIANY